MLFHNFPSSIRLVLFLERVLILLVWSFLKSLKQTLIQKQNFNRLHCFIFQQILLTELLTTDQQLILFVYSDQLLSFYIDFWFIHNLTNILWCRFHHILLLTFLFLHIILYQNQQVDHTSFLFWWLRYKFL